MMKKEIKEILEQTFAYNLENDKVAQELWDLYSVVGLSEQLKAFRKWMIENECTRFGSDDFVVNDYIKSL